MPSKTGCVWENVECNQIIYTHRIWPWPSEKLSKRRTFRNRNEFWRHTRLFSLAGPCVWCTNTKANLPEMDSPPSWKETLSWPWFITSSRGFTRLFIYERTERSLNVIESLLYIKKKNKKQKNKKKQNKKKKKKKKQTKKTQFPCDIFLIVETYIFTLAI